VFPDSKMPWFTGVTDAIDGVRDFDREAIVWLKCRGMWLWEKECSCNLINDSMINICITHSLLQTRA
jgi:hypothetical protein